MAITIVTISNMTVLIPHVGGSTDSDIFWMVEINNPRYRLTCANSNNFIVPEVFQYYKKIGNIQKGLPDEKYLPRLVEKSRSP